jgi:hypothetical protein
VASFAPLVLYFFVPDKMGNKTCDVDVSITGTGKPLLVLHYVGTAIVLRLFGWFYLVWQRTLKMAERFSKDG